MSNLYSRIVSQLIDVSEQDNCVFVEVENGEFFSQSLDIEQDELKISFVKSKIDLTEQEQLELYEWMHGSRCVYVFSEEYLQLY